MDAFNAPIVKATAFHLKALHIAKNAKIKYQTNYYQNGKVEIGVVKKFSKTFAYINPLDAVASYLKKIPIVNITQVDVNSVPIYAKVLKKKV